MGIPPYLAAIGAVLSGSSSVISACVSIRWERRRARDACDKRIRELRQAFDRGMTYQRRIDRVELGDTEHEDRWSGLP